MTRSRPLAVAALYTLAAVVMTWPLLPNITRALAWDLGDPVFNCWVLQWTGGQILEVFHGHLGALHQYWYGNIFHPEPLTLAYSEHLTPQAIEMLPLFAITKNIVLCYNLLILSTFVLSALGAYLLVFELTGQPVAAIVAGLAFGFAPYRVAQMPHLQVLSSQWMPFALLGFRRFFVTGRLRPLAWGSAALAVQNLSCGYYMLFFPPFVGAYCLYEMAHRRLLRSWTTWRALAIAAVAVVLVAWPFVTPYFEVRLNSDIGVRPLTEIVKLSADTHAYATVTGYLSLWGSRMRSYAVAEGEGFQGFATMALALVGVMAGAIAARRGAGRPAEPVSPWQGLLAGALGVWLIAGAAGFIALCVIGPFRIPMGQGQTVVRNGALLLTQLLVLSVAIVAILPAGRRFVAGAKNSAWGFFVCAAVAAVLLSLGPHMRAGGIAIGNGPYFWLYNHVPGFDGLRVPARFFMLVALFLSVLAGYGAAAIVARWKRPGAIAVLAAGVFMLVEGYAPFRLDDAAGSPGYNGPPSHVNVAAHMSPVYQLIEKSPAGTVLIEFPFGDERYDVQATFYAGYHRKPLVNGYSGFFPASYEHRAAYLQRFPDNPDQCWQVVVASGATHALVHEGAYRDATGRLLVEWLTSHGARDIAAAGTDHLFMLK